MQLFCTFFGKLKFNFSYFCFQTYGPGTSGGVLYSVFDFGFLLLFVVVLMCQLRVLLFYGKKDFWIYLLCSVSVIAFLISMAFEEKFENLRCYHSMRTVFKDFNSYLIIAACLMFTSYLENMDVNLRK